MNFTTKVGALVSAFAMVFISACSSNVNKASTAVQLDGLALVPDTKFREYYRKPGADLSNYAQIEIEPCKVSFRTNWQRDQNTNRTDLSSRVTDSDVTRILDRMSDSCNDKFHEALEASTAYKLVDGSDIRESVLILRPSIIDLDVHAPDLRGAGFTRTFTRSTGEMTLSLDIIDGASGEVIARAVDRRRDTENHQLEPTASVNNQSDFDRSIRRWTRHLREGLDAATL